MLQEALTRSNIKTERLTATGWMTMLKLIERDVNMIPLGLLTHTGAETSLLRVLTPAMLKMNNLSNRAPVGIFKTPDSANDIMAKTTKAYKLWYKVFTTAYVPYLMSRQKWHEGGDNICKGDVVYFKLTESPLGADWRIGLVEQVKVGRDGVVREICVTYKHENDGTCMVVERPVRNIVKLFHLDDTCLMDQIKQIEVFAKDLVDDSDSWIGDKVNHQEYTKESCDMLENNELQKRLEYFSGLKLTQERFCVNLAAVNGVNKSNTEKIERNSDPIFNIIIDNNIIDTETVTFG